MTALLGFSSLIDRLNHWIGKLTMWFILATTLISAGNAIVRKAFSISSNALLEIQPGEDALPVGSAVPALLTGELLR